MPSRYEKKVRLSSGSDALVADRQSRLAVIVTHPWGLLGGNMHNNVVTAAVLYFQSLGITTVRFDFCGSVGRGYAQVEQVQEVAQGLLTGKFTSNTVGGSGGEVRPLHILLLGYSYGSLITGSASADIPETIALISVAPPFAVQHWLLMFNSSYHLQRASEREDLPRLLVIGSDDNFTTEKSFKDIVENRFPPETTTGAVIKGADHFFGHRERDLMNVIGQWLLSTFPQCQGDLKKLRNIEFGIES